MKQADEAPDAYLARLAAAYDPTWLKLVRTVAADFEQSSAEVVG